MDGADPYSQFVPGSPAIFQAPDKKSTLSELIEGDIRELTASRFGKLAVQKLKSLSIVERFSPDPNAQIVRITDKSEENVALIFHSPIIWFLNNVSITFCSAFTFQPYLHQCENVGPRTTRMHGENAVTISSFLELLEALRTKASLNLRERDEVTFLGSRFDLCERVEGARRLIVAHELGHICLLAHKEMSDLFVDERRFIEQVLRPHLADLPGEVRENWIDECCCDVFGVMLTLMRHLEQLSAAKQSNDPGVRWIINRIVNTVLGITLLFKQYAYFDLVRFANSSANGSLNSFRREFAHRKYPPSEIRLTLVMHFVRQLCPWAVECERMKVFQATIEEFEEMVTSYFDVDWEGSDEFRLMEPGKTPRFRSRADVNAHMDRFYNIDEYIEAMGKLQFNAHDMMRITQSEFQFKFCEEWRKYRARPDRVGAEKRGGKQGRTWADRFRGWLKRF